MPHDLDTTPLQHTIRQHNAFAEFSAEALDRLIEGSSIVAFAPDEILVRQGADSDAAFFILEGEVEVIAESSFGAVPLARLPARSLIGDIGVLANLPRTATLRAIGPVNVLRIGRDGLLQAGRDHPGLLISVIGQLGQRLGAVNKAVGFYTNALAALERQDFDPAILDTLLNPVPELVDFAQTFRRMAEQIILRRRQHDEMASASIIQRAMLPRETAMEEFAGKADIHAEMRPAREVGGDFYDVLRLDERRVGISVGDVCGKGVPASLFMAITQTVARLVVRQELDLASAMARANLLLCADNVSSMFATLFYAILDLETGELTYCNCGHNPPLLVRGDGSIEMLTNTGIALAMFDEAPYSSRTTRLEPGDRLFLYSDGITEAHNEDKALFGDDRLKATIRMAASLPGRQAIDSIIAAVDEFAGDAPQFDDITCLSLHFLPAN
ncbi:SpoIIE family protein phosphatase [Parvibaculum sedimenti]|uniref:SpoIIE family protein phosphatase n=1 Tax=Parvibaculum sedimenti TaxID=2608632 RepID=A0A6N6VLN5_9HYPH|nr:SpoIIE family protein phosphatase [Parvibaculum sedimenti]KAB7739527.1 SpoIIE family protein phosphatase [Parvibaculum sedimenti]